MPVCVVCRSKKFRRRDGVLICEYGHQLNYHQQQSDGESVGGQTRQFKRKKGPRRELLLDETGQDDDLGGAISADSSDQSFFFKRRIGRNAVPKHLVLEIFQYGLRHQVVALVKSLDLPPELEHIVMEMWLLLVSKMNVHFVYRKQRSRSRSRSRSVRSMTTDSESEGTSLMGGYSSYSFSSACTDWTTDFEDVLVDDQGDEFDAQNMHRKSSAVTTDSEAAVIKLEESQNAEIEEVEESNSQQERKTRSFSVNDIYVFGRFPREPTRSSIIKSIHPIYSLALIYFACNWLRIPITLADIFRWANDGVIPYMSSFSALPEALVAEVKLKKATLFPAGQMQPESVPKFYQLHIYTSLVGSFFHEHYEIIPPPVNTPLLRMRILKELGLGEEFYILSTVLSEIRDGFLVTPRRPLEIYLDGKKTTKTRNKTALPSRNVSHFLNEVENCRVAASILVACKFVYGLDGTVRFERAAYPFLASVLPLEDLLSNMVRLRPKLTGFLRWSIKDLTLVDKSSIQQYLNFVEKEVVHSDAKNKELQSCYDFSKSSSANVPLRPTEGASTIMINPRSIEEYEEMDTIPIGIKYSKYRVPPANDKEVSMEYPSSYGLILACLCEFIGATPEVFEKSVKELERELEFWQPL